MIPLGRVEVGYDVILRMGADDEGVGSSPAGQIIRSGAADDCVVTATAVDRVGAGAPDEVFALACSPNSHFSRLRLELVRGTRLGRANVAKSCQSPTGRPGTLRLSPCRMVDLKG